MLISSSATGPDGKDTALQTASGQIYQFASNKSSIGCFNGLKGTLLMRNDKVLTFLPDENGSSKTIVASQLSTLQIVDTAGSKYPLTNDTRVFYNSKEQSWSEVYTWLNPGTALTLYLGSNGNVEYIFVGGGSIASEAVIVYNKGSTDNFKTLTGGASGYSIYKNGIQANATDMRSYDVATYSSATNSIRVCDVRLTGYYESCKPNPTEPTSITMFGQEFPVLTTAQATLARFRPGDQMTLLLTEDNQIAGAVKVGTSGMNFASLQRLNKLEAVPNTAWSGQSAVTMDGRTYTIPSDVQCYNKGLHAWVTLEEAHAYANVLDMYESDGIIRIIEVGS